MLTEKGILSGFRQLMIQRFSPDATEADIGDEMKAYYDNERKVWVFPGEDPDEKAKPVGPPPTAPAAQTTVQPAPIKPEANDPLALMMAPPQRGPTALRTKSLPVKDFLPPGMPVSGAQPQFAVFKPSVGAKEEDTVVTSYESR